MNKTCLVSDVIQSDECFVEVPKVNNS